MMFFLGMSSRWRPLICGDSLNACAFLFLFMASVGVIGCCSFGLVPLRSERGTWVGIAQAMDVVTESGIRRQAVVLDVRDPSFQGPSTARVPDDNCPLLVDKSGVILEASSAGYLGNTIRVRGVLRHLPSNAKDQNGEMVIREYEMAKVTSGEEMHTDFTRTIEYVLVVEEITEE